MRESLRKHGSVLICVALAVVVFAVYLPVRNHQFVKYDDNTYITDNHRVRYGFSWRSVREAFNSGYASNWHPLTWLSHMLDCQLFGLRAGPHHLTSVFFHVANTLLLLLILKAMTGALWPSAFVAAAFGLHPLHVESVAWVAERKDVLSTFFWLLTMWAYYRYAKRPNPVQYAFIVILFAMGLMAKPMVVTLPFVLLLCDYWPLERWGKTKVKWLIVEKVPLFALSVVSGIITFVVQRSGGAMPAVEAVNFRMRLTNAVVSYVVYIVKMVWPSRLATLYPHPLDKIPIITVVFCAAVLIALTAACVYFGRRYRYLVFGWFWYLGTLVPVIGLIQVGAQARADRYTYIPLTGLFVIIAFGVKELAAKGPTLKRFFVSASFVVLAVAVVLSRMQLRHWRNSGTLFEHTLKVTTNNWWWHNNYAIILSKSDRLVEAMTHFGESLRIRPESVVVHTNLGNALVRTGKINEAIEYYRRALELDPDFAESHYNLAVALSKQGDKAGAISEYRQAAELDPTHSDALSNLGSELARKEQFEQAVEFYGKALEIAPDDVVTRGRLGLALAEIGQTDRAIDQFRIVLNYRPDDVQMYCNLGILLARQGNINQAAVQYRRALQIAPNNTRAQELLQAALAEMGNR